MNRLPPGPKNPILSSYRFYNDAMGYIQACGRDFGDPFMLPLVGDRLVMTGDPEGIRQIFMADPDIFRSAATPLEALVGTEALVTQSGLAHRRSRKVLTGPYHGREILIYGDRIQRTAMRHAETWRPGEKINLFRAMKDISLEIIIRTVFGVGEDTRVRLFQTAIDETMARYTPLFSYIPYSQHNFGGFGPWARYRRASDKLVALLQEEIRAKRSNGLGSQDVLSLLLGSVDDDGKPMPDSWVIDQMRGLLLGGNETPAITLAWALYEIERHPAVKDRLLSELDALGPEPGPNALAAIPYLGAVCDETLRLHPVIAAGSRRLESPFELKGYTLPPELMVCFAPAITHFDEAIYPEPIRFRPERFLDKSYSPFEFLSFGGGMRRCLGITFARYQMMILLGTILCQHRIRLASNKPLRTILYGIPLGPEDGVPAIYEGRRTPPAAAHVA